MIANTVIRNDKVSEILAKTKSSKTAVRLILLACQYIIWIKKILIAISSKYVLMLSQVENYININCDRPLTTSKHLS